jgi:hypothetical protein
MGVRLRYLTRPMSLTSMSSKLHSPNSLGASTLACPLLIISLLVESEMLVRVPK